MRRRRFRLLPVRGVASRCLGVFACGALTFGCLLSGGCEPSELKEGSKEQSGHAADRGGQNQAPVNERKPAGGRDEAEREAREPMRGRDSEADAERKPPKTVDADRDSAKSVDAEREPRKPTDDAKAKRANAPDEAQREQPDLYLGGDIDEDDEVDIYVYRPGERGPAPGQLIEPSVTEGDAGREAEREPVAGRAETPPPEPATERPEPPTERPETPLPTASPRPPAAGPQVPPGPSPGPLSASPRAEPGSVLECYQISQNLGLTDYQARQLCETGIGVGPALCTQAALAETLLEDYRVLELCECATSTEPVRCYQQAQQNTELSEFDAVRLCSPALSRRLGAGCLPVTGAVLPFP